MRMRRPSGVYIATTLAIFGCTQVAHGQHYYLPQELFSPTPSTDESFGLSVYVDNDYTIVGSWQEDVSAFHDGRVNIYDSTTGAYLRRIEGPNMFLNGGYGISVDREGDLLLVGAFTDLNTHGSAGGAYLHDVHTGVEIAHFVTQIADPGDWIGYSVAIQAPLALLGAPNDDDGGNQSGAVYAFLTNSLFELTKIKPNVPITGENFGHSVVIEGDYIVVGAPSLTADQAGSVYVYDVDTGVQLRRIQPAGIVDRDEVGRSVDLSIESGTPIIAIGAPGDDSAGPNAGAVYLYNAATGGLIRKITRDDAGPQDSFGESVAIEGAKLVVGSTNRDQTGFGTGSVFVYDMAITGTGDIDEVAPFNQPDRQNFGRRVAINDGIIVGAGVGEIDEVSGYAAILRQFCDADINNDGAINFFDVSAFIKFAIDFNGDGQFNFFDISAFLVAFNSGCS